jgi:tripartite-type tricarboxylate transporter receptor subunit TctC
MRLFTRRIFTAALLAAVPFTSALAQDNFPSRPIKIVVPFPPGGGSDMVARMLANGMREKLGQPVLVDNKAGAGTVIGTDMVAKSPADGYTILWMATPFGINASLLKSLPYDTLKDFTPVIDLVEMPLVMIVHPSSPAKNVKEFIELAKKEPGKLSYGSSGNGGSPHLAMEIFKTATGTSLTHVPYRGSAPSVQDLIAGQTDVVMDTTILVAPHVRAGKARALAQSGSKRSSYLPDVPTMQEEGVAGYEVTSWMSLAVPAGTPNAVVQKLNEAAKAVFTAPAMREQLSKQGLDVIAGTPEDSARRLRVEIDKWAKAIQTSGAKPD